MTWVACCLQQHALGKVNPSFLITSLDYTNQGHQRHQLQMAVHIMPLLTTIYAFMFMHASTVDVPVS
eukprot:10309-Eustigmatos_ZCMA.PRE.1